MSVEIFEFDEISNCCGASFCDETSDGFGRCGSCFEMAEVELVNEFGEISEGC